MVRSSEQGGTLSAHGTWGDHQPSQPGVPFAKAAEKLPPERSLGPGMAATAFFVQENAAQGQERCRTAADLSSQMLISAVKIYPDRPTGQPSVRLNLRDKLLSCRLNSSGNK